MGLLLSSLNFTCKLSVLSGILKGNELRSQLLAPAAQGTLFPHQQCLWRPTSDLSLCDSKMLSNLVYVGFQV